MLYLRLCENAGVVPFSRMKLNYDETSGLFLSYARKCLVLDVNESYRRSKAEVQNLSEWFEGLRTKV
jgi:hypothetical protein